MPRAKENHSIRNDEDSSNSVIEEFSSSAQRDVRTRSCVKKTSYRSLFLDSDDEVEELEESDPSEGEHGKMKNSEPISVQRKEQQRKSEQPTGMTKDVQKRQPYIKKPRARRPKLPIEEYRKKNSARQRARRAQMTEEQREENRRKSRERAARRRAAVKSYGINQSSQKRAEYERMKVANMTPEQREVWEEKKKEKAQSLREKKKETAGDHSKIISTRNRLIAYLTKEVEGGVCHLPFLQNPNKSINGEASAETKSYLEDKLAFEVHLSAITAFIDKSLETNEERKVYKRLNCRQSKASRKKIAKPLQELEPQECDEWYFKPYFLFSIQYEFEEERRNLCTEALELEFGPDVPKSYADRDQAKSTTSGTSADHINTVEAQDRWKGYLQQESSCENVEVIDLTEDDEIKLEPDDVGNNFESVHNWIARVLTEEENDRTTRNSQVKNTYGQLPSASASATAEATVEMTKIMSAPTIAEQREKLKKWASLNWRRGKLLRLKQLKDAYDTARNRWITERPDEADKRQELDDKREALRKKTLENKTYLIERLKLLLSKNREKYSKETQEERKKRIDNILRNQDESTDQIDKSSLTVTNAKPKISCAGMTEEQKKAAYAAAAKKRVKMEKDEYELYLSLAKILDLVAASSDTVESASVALSQFESFILEERTIASIDYWYAYDSRAGFEVRDFRKLLHKKLYSRIKVLPPKASDASASKTDSPHQNKFELLHVSKEESLKDLLEIKAYVEKLGDAIKQYLEYKRFYLNNKQKERIKAVLKDDEKRKIYNAHMRQRYNKKKRGIVIPLGSYYGHPRDERRNKIIPKDASESDKPKKATKRKKKAVDGNWSGHTSTVSKIANIDTMDSTSAIATTDSNSANATMDSNSVDDFDDNSRNNNGSSSDVWEPSSCSNAVLSVMDNANRLSLDLTPTIQYNTRFQETIASRYTGSSQSLETPHQPMNSFQSFGNVPFTSNQLQQSIESMGIPILSPYDQQQQHNQFHTSMQPSMPQLELVDQGLNSYQRNHNPAQWENASNCNNTNLLNFPSMYIQHLVNSVHPETSSSCAMNLQPWNVASTIEIALSSATSSSSNLQSNAINYSQHQTSELASESDLEEVPDPDCEEYLPPSVSSSQTSKRSRGRPKGYKMSDEAKARLALKRSSRSRSSLPGVRKDIWNNLKRRKYHGRFQNVAPSIPGAISDSYTPKTLTEINSPFERNPIKLIKSSLSETLEQLVPKGSTSGKLADADDHSGTLADADDHSGRLANADDHSGKLADADGKLEQVPDAKGNTNQVSDADGKLEQVPDAKGNTNQVFDAKENSDQFSDAEGNSDQVADTDENSELPNSTFKYSHKRRNPNAILECSLCSAQTEGQLELIHHIFKAHWETHRFICPFTRPNTEGKIRCFQWYLFERDALRDHIVKFHSTSKRSRNRGGACEKTWIMGVHMRTMTKGAKKFMCCKCDISIEFKSYSELVDHYHSEHNKRYCCEVCGIYLIEDNFLRDHLKLFHPDKSFIGPLNLIAVNAATINRCQVCYSEFFSQELLDHHISQGHAFPNEDQNSIKRKFRCDSCDKTFKTARCLENHFITCNASKYDCYWCNTKFRCGNLLEKHIKESHPNEPPTPVNPEPSYFHEPYKCEMCKKSFMNLHNLRYHCVISHELHKYLQNLVQKGFDMNEITEPQPQRTYRGVRCRPTNLTSFNEDSSQISQAQVESKSITTTDPTNLDWTKLPTAIRNERLLNSTDFTETQSCRCGFVVPINMFHIVHHRYNELMRRYCSQCNKVFSRNVVLRQHNEAVHGILPGSVPEPPSSGVSGGPPPGVTSDDWLPCKMCNLGFTVDEFHRNHTFTQIHDNIKCCKDCGRKFLTEDRYLKHMHEVHDVPLIEKMRVFRNSSKSSATSKPPPPKKRELREEDYGKLTFSTTVKTEAGELTVYSCKVCLKNFKSNDFIRLHIQHMHAEDAFTRVLCEQCNSTFSSFEILGRHKRNQHGSNRVRFQCPICNMFTTRMCHLRVHCRKVHGATFKNEDIQVLPYDEFAKISNKRFPCTICCRDFKTQDGVNSHLKSQHLCFFNSTFCDICGLQINPKHLKHHLDSTHPAEKDKVVDNLDDKTTKNKFLSLLQVVNMVQGVLDSIKTVESKKVTSDKQPKRKRQKVAVSKTKKSLDKQRKGSSSEDSLTDEESAVSSSDQESLVPSEFEDDSDGFGRQDDEKEKKGHCSMKDLIIFPEKGKRNTRASKRRNTIRYVPDSSDSEDAPEEICSAGSASQDSKRSKNHSAAKSTPIQIEKEKRLVISVEKCDLTALMNLTKQSSTRTDNKSEGRELPEVIVIKEETDLDEDFGRQDKSIEQTITPCTSNTNWKIIKICPNGDSETDSDPDYDPLG